MPKMVDLKRKNGRDSLLSEDVEDDFFPVNIWLSDEEVDKLGLVDVESGEELPMVAMVKVSSVTSSDSERGGKRTSVQLDVVKASIGSDKKKSDAEVMFGDE